MKLSKPVMNEEGIVLLGEDTELNEAIIEKLKSLNVATVDIIRVNKPDMSLEKALFELDKRFENVENEPYMAMLKKILKEHITGLYG